MIRSNQTIGVHPPPRSTNESFQQQAAGEPHLRIVPIYRHESAFLDHFFKVLVRGEDKFRIDRPWFYASDRDILPVLKCPQKFRLQPERQVSDLVKKYSAAHRRAQFADRILEGPGKCALLEAEKLAFK